MTEVVYNKLVRDNIPEITRANDGIPFTRILNDKEFNIKLNEKLIEEVKEYLESEDILELADILEVIHAIIEAKGYSFKELEEIRLEKSKKRGGFKKKILLEKVVSK